MAEQLNRVELLRLARLGATSRLEELRREIVSLETLLGGDAPRRKESARNAAEDREGCAGGEGCEGPRRRRRPHAKKSAWSPAARRAVSLRMKKYWAARRQAKKR